MSKFPMSWKKIKIYIFFYFYFHQANCVIFYCSCFCIYLKITIYHRPIHAFINTILWWHHYKINATLSVTAPFYCDWETKQCIESEPCKEGMSFNTQWTPGMRYSLSDLNTSFQPHRILKVQLHFNRQTEFLRSAVRQMLCDQWLLYLSGCISNKACQPCSHFLLTAGFSVRSARLLLCVE